MLAQDKAESGLVFSLLRRAGESNDDTLQRLSSLPLNIESEDIANPTLRKLFTFVVDNASNNRAVGTRLAAQELGKDEFEIVQSVELADPDALDVYAQAVFFWSNKRALAQAASTAQQVAANADRPQEGLDKITEIFASLDLSEEDRVGTIPEKVALGHEAIASIQAALKSGAPRVHFHHSHLDLLVPMLLPGNLILLTAKSKVGKTSWASQFFDFNIRQGMTGIYFHFEDTPEVMHMRRLARQMLMFRDPATKRLTRAVADWLRLTGCWQQNTGASLTDEETESMLLAEQAIVNDLSAGIEVYAGGWTMKQVVSTWHRLELRARYAGKHIDLVVVDYLNKAEQNYREVNAFGMPGVIANDVEIIKRTAEKFRTVGLIIQQENDTGDPYMSRAPLQKSQVWLSLERDKLPGSEALDSHGQIKVKYANIGQTGEVNIELVPRYMAWQE